MENKKHKIGITGQSGFIGYHLYNFLRMKKNISLVDFNRNLFSNTYDLAHNLNSCDIIIHLAGMNRDVNSQNIYDTNMSLTNKLIIALEKCTTPPKVIFASSSQEENNNNYGKSKLDSRIKLENWADKTNGKINTLIIPNVFGPFCKPFYNSFIATFCNQIHSGEQPKIISDNEVGLIYVGDLAKLIFELIVSDDWSKGVIKVNYSIEIKVSSLLKKLIEFHESYNNYIIPKLKDKFESDLFNTYLSYQKIDDDYPKKNNKHSDNRGFFSEIYKSKSETQISYSLTKPGVTRGNHFHTSKIEIFIIIKGKAQIQLRKIGEKKVHSFTITDKSPKFIDMPIWYTHNVKNIGSDELIIIFCINKFYTNLDPDTYHEKVEL